MNLVYQHNRFLMFDILIHQHIKYLMCEFDILICWYNRISNYHPLVKSSIWLFPNVFSHFAPFGTGPPDRDRIWSPWQPQHIKLLQVFECFGPFGRSKEEPIMSKHKCSFGFIRFLGSPYQFWGPTTNPMKPPGRLGIPVSPTRIDIWYFDISDYQIRLIWYLILISNLISDLIFDIKFDITIDIRFGFDIRFDMLI